MTIWVRPSGTEIETNDLPATIEACEAMGWKIKGEEQGSLDLSSDEAPEAPEAPKPKKAKAKKAKAE